MKIKVRKTFKYMLDTFTTHELLPGEYIVGRQVDKYAAELALSFGYAVVVPEKPKKKAPEKKVVKVAENK